MKDIEFTVVIPTYNRKDLLAETLNSLFSQSFNNFKILISDNASTDGTEEYVKTINDDRVIYYKHNQNIGMQRNWEFCLKYPKSGFVALLEDDNLWHDSFLEVANELLLKNKDVAFYATSTIIFNNELQVNWTPYWLEKDEIFHSINDKKAQIYFLQRNPIAASSMIINSKSIQNIPFDLYLNHWNMDQIWWSYLTFDYNGYIINNRLLAKYRSHSNSITNILYSGNPRSVIQSMNHYIEFSKKILEKNPNNLNLIVEEFSKWEEQFQFFLVCAWANSKNPQVKLLSQLALKIKPIKSYKHRSRKIFLSKIFGYKFIKQISNLDKLWSIFFNLKSFLKISKF